MNCVDYCGEALNECGSVTGRRSEIIVGMHRPGLVSVSCLSPNIRKAIGAASRRRPPGAALQIRSCGPGQAEVQRAAGVPASPAS